jgi:hypothetical protein
MERLSALGALPEDIENVVRSAQQEVLTRLSQRTGIPFNRGMQLSLFDPAMLHQEIEVHNDPNPGTHANSNGTSG